MQPTTLDFTTPWPSVEPTGDLAVRAGIAGDRGEVLDGRECSTPRRALDLDDDRHRAVVDDVDGHARAEDAGLNRDTKIS